MKAILEFVDQAKNPTKLDAIDNYIDNITEKSKIAENSNIKTGIVKWFNDAKGYGFIAQDNGGPDVWAHFTNIMKEGFRSLEEGEEVEFEIFNSGHGPTARNIRSST